MGLDSVELVMAFEEQFGVALGDDEVVHAVTPRKVTDLIFSKLQASDARTCQTQRAFHVLRRGLMDLVGIDRRRVTLDTPLADLLPPPRQLLLWPELGRRVKARRWPELVRSNGLTNTICLAALLLPLWPAAQASNHGVRIGIATTLWTAGAVVVSAAGHGLTRTCRRYVPPHYRTVRDLVPAVLSSDEIAWTREAVAVQVKRIVLEQFGVPEDRYAEDAEFVRDFGMD